MMPLGQVAVTVAPRFLLVAFKTPRGTRMSPSNNFRANGPFTFLFSTENKFVSNVYTSYISTEKQTITLTKVKLAKKPRKIPSG